MLVCYSALVCCIRFYAKYIIYAAIFLFLVLQEEIAVEKLYIYGRILPHQSSGPKIRDSGVTPAPITRTVAIMAIWVKGN
jgi:hypothetical protein